MDGSASPAVVAILCRVPYSILRQALTVTPAASLVDSRPLPWGRFQSFSLNRPGRPVTQSHGVAPLGWAAP